MPEEMVAANAQLNRAGQSEYLDRVALDWVASQWTSFDQLLSPWHKRWARAWAAFENKPVRSFYNGNSKVTPPDIFIRVMRLVPRMESKILGRSDFFEPRPRTPAEADKARANKELLSAQMEMDGFRFNFGQPFLIDAIVYGTAIGKIGWRYLVEEGDFVEAGDGGLDMATGEIQHPYDTVSRRITTNSPHAEPGDPFNFRFDPRVSCVEDTPIIEESMITPDELREMEAAGLVTNVEKALRDVGSGMTETPNASKMLRDRASRLDSPQKRDSKKVLLKYRERWGRFPLDLKPGENPEKARTVETVIGVINDTTVVRLSKNPLRGFWKPYDFCRIVPIRGSILGVSLAEKALDLWYEKRDTRNMALDTRAYTISPMFTADPSHRGTAYVAGHGKVLRGSNLRQVIVQDTSQSAMLHEQVIGRDLDDIFATPPLMSGQELGGEGGATGAAIQESNASTNLDGYVSAAIETFYKRFLKKWHALDQQFLDDVVPLSVLGERGLEWRYIYPDEIQGDFDFVVTGGRRMLNPAILGANFPAIMATFQNLQLMGQIDVDWPRLSKDYLREVIGVEHPELYINPRSGVGPIPGIPEVIELLTIGQKVSVDERMNLPQAFREMTLFVARVVPRIGDPRVRKAILTYYRELEAATQRWILQQKMLQEQKMMALIGAPPPKEPAGAEEGGGSQTAGAPRAAHSDGKGFTAPRRLMESMAGGPIGAR